MTSARPLGVFDSGLGGLTVVRAIRDALPDERIVYLGDTARVPYGTRSPETIVRYARGCARVLADRGVKSLVVACNTVSAVALEMLRVEFDLPVLGVVEPGARAALDALARLGSVPERPEPKIGVLGTLGTIRSGAYVRAIGRLSTRAEVVAVAAPLLVPLVEEGWLEGDVPRLAVRRYVAPLVDAGARVFLLGCTHYPLVAPLVEETARELAGSEVFVVDGAAATASELVAWMDEGRVVRAPSGNASEPGALELLVTDLPSSFAEVASRFLGAGTPEVRQIDLG
ncbi:MAG TPA: glutamate racemase [Polyangiaceae bacterium]|nr:glutamate racemase [Polyangiaceae bacterium]